MLASATRGTPSTVYIPSHPTKYTPQVCKHLTLHNLRNNVTYGPQARSASMVSTRTSLLVIRRLGWIPISTDPKCAHPKLHTYVKMRINQVNKENVEGVLGFW